jgi:hypothetical protein
VYDELDEYDGEDDEEVVMWINVLFVSFFFSGEGVVATVA